MDPNAISMGLDGYVKTPSKAVFFHIPIGLHLESKDTVASHTVTVKGTSYKRGMFILLGKAEEELEVGKIELVIVHQGSVSFVSEKYSFLKLRDIGVYCVLGTPHFNRIKMSE